MERCDGCSGAGADADAGSTWAGLTHLPRRTQMDEAVFPVKL